MTTVLAGILALTVTDPREAAPTMKEEPFPFSQNTWTIRLVDFQQKPLSDAPVSLRFLDYEFVFGRSVNVSLLEGKLLDETLRKTRQGCNTLWIELGPQNPAQDAVISAAEEQGFRIFARPQTDSLDAVSLSNVVSRYAGKVHGWEIAPDPIGRNVPAEETARICAIARRLAPDTLTLLSEPALGAPELIEALVVYVHECRAAGAAFDGAVIRPASPRRGRPKDASEALATLSELGVCIYIAELPERETAKLLPALYGREYIQGVITESAGRKRGTLQEFLQETWPSAIQTRTGPDGVVSFAGCYGDYEVKVDEHIFKVRLDRSSPKELTLTWPPTPAPPLVFRFPFQAENADAARTWQSELREQLRKLISAQNPCQDLPLDVEVGEAAEHEQYAAHDLTFLGNEGTRIEATLTVPKGQGPFPAVVCLHGHGGDRFMMHDSSSLYGGLAAGFAARGFVTLAPSLWHCNYATNQLWNLMRLVDVLETLPFVDKDHIGCAGLSMGGEWTMWLAAMDRRVRAAVVSGWMCSTEGVLSIHNCPCWMTPGLLDLCDIAEVHLLIAPRPLLFESASSDGCFPIRYTDEGYRAVVRGYRVLDAAMNVRRHVFPGGHAWNGGLAYRFMADALAKTR